MKNALLALFVLASTVCFAQDKPNTFGKSNAQILAMGQEKWMSFADKQGGGSNAAMIDASMAYQAASAGRNDRLLKTKPGMAVNVHHLRELLGDYTGDCMEVGSYISGGGSMWGTFDAYARAESEDVLFGVLGGKAAPAPKMTVSMVARELQKAKTAIHANRSNDQFGMTKETGANKSLQAAQAHFASIAKICAKLDRRGSDFVLSFCKSQAQNATNGGG
jgi:hypothetical protein